MEFQIKDSDYIELNKLLKLLRLVESGGEANNHIINGEVKVNKKIETQKRKKLKSGDMVQFKTLIIKVTKKNHLTND